jgi:hypothetical protein
MPVQTRSMTSHMDDFTHIEYNQEELKRIIYKFNPQYSTPMTILGVMLMYPIYLVGISIIFSGVYYLNLIL